MYIHDTLKRNLDLWLKNVEEDWDFVLIVSAGGSVRVGKCQTKGSKVLMKDGSWKNVEDIVAGDEVISPDIITGKNSVGKVIELHSRFEEDCYDVIKNSTGEVLYSCAGNHDIPIEYSRPIRKNMSDGTRKIIGYKKIRKTMEAQELFKQTEWWYKQNSVGTYQGFYVDSFNGRSNPEVEPYTLGYFLGDGHFRSVSTNRKNLLCGTSTQRKSYMKTMKSGKIVNVSEGPRVYEHIEYLKYKSRNVGITSATIESMNYILNYYQSIRTYKKPNNKASTYNFSIDSSLSKQLISLGLEGKGSGNKFIPYEVKKADADYRMKVLSGLIDSDGYVDKDGKITICSKSKQLIEDIIEVTRSLGGNGEIKKIRKGIKSIGFIGNYFSTSINLGKRTKELMLLNPLKKSRINLNTRLTNIGFRLRKREPEMVYGFELDSKSHLYITDNFTVTHNSVIALQIAAYWHYMLWKLYGKEVPFTIEDNIVFNGNELIKKGNHLGEKYKSGCLIFDEAGADLEGVKVMKKTTQAVKDYLRECGQYNLLTILVLPEFFDLPKSIALSRTDALVDCFVTVGKDDKWERGHFNFFSRTKKKKLYLLGKKELNYAAANADFHGDWELNYPVDEAEYRKAKAVALKTRAETTAKESRMGAYLKGALKMLVSKGQTYAEIAREIASLQHMTTSHNYIARLMNNEEEFDDDNE